MLARWFSPSWADAMPPTVAGEECDALAVQRANNVCVRRSAEWCIEFDFFDVGQRLHLVDAATADYAEANWFWHEINSVKS